MAEELGFAIVGLRRGYQAAQEVVQTDGDRGCAVIQQGKITHWHE